jgi:site-specific DNA-cytosine methylase
MNAQYYGVPQSRQRLIFVGIRNDIWADIQIPQKTEASE